MKKITHDKLISALNYDADTGIFTYSKDAQKYRKGDVAGNIGIAGYMTISIGVENIRAHRLAWFFVHKKWPDDLIDHINGIRHDNRLSNLRECTNQENAQNTKKCRPNNKSGLMGASWHSKAKRWAAQIGMNGKRVYLGLFDTPEEAHAEYLRAKVEMHPFQTLVKKEK